MTPKIILSRSTRRAYRLGHPWIYRSQIKDVVGGPDAGDLVDVYSEKMRFIGMGYLNPASEISVRILSSEKTPVDADFFKKKIERCTRFREPLVKQTNAYRLVAGEADELPGLIVDRYGETLVVQFLTLGMDRLRPLVLEALREKMNPRGIFERSDSASRKLEGLSEKTGWIERACTDETEIFEKDIRYRVRFGEGHKTGFYLDQRENRILLGEWGIRGEVLDCFCYSGGFGLHLAKNGATVLGIDSQKEAVALAEENRALNGIGAERLAFKTANVFDELRSLEKSKKKFDLVILDPPSFVKRKSELEGALAGTKEIVLRAMKLLRDGGLLAVFSCSYHVDDGLLMQTCLSAAWDTQKSLRVLKFMKQSQDHPIDPFVPETYYLKGFLFWVNAR